MPTLSSRIGVLGAVGVLAAACAGSRERVYVAPSNETIQSGTEMTFGGDGQAIYIVNHSTVPIVITGLRLTSCENVKSRCDETMRLRVRVGPGRRETVHVVRPDNPNRGHSFRFSYTWEPAREG